MPVRPHDEHGLKRQTQQMHDWRCRQQILVLVNVPNHRVWSCLPSVPQALSPMVCGGEESALLGEQHAVRPLSVIW